VTTVSKYYTHTTHNHKTLKQTLMCSFTNVGHTPLLLFNLHLR